MRAAAGPSIRPPLGPYSADRHAWYDREDSGQPPSVRGVRGLLGSRIGVAMAILRDLGSGEAVPLAARVVVGRASTATLRLGDSRVSGEHATVLWTGAAWEIRDLGSRNGTFVDGGRVGAG